MEIGVFSLLPTEIFSLSDMVSIYVKIAMLRPIFKLEIVLTGISIPIIGYVKWDIGVMDDLEKERLLGRLV